MIKGSVSFSISNEVLDFDYINFTIGFLPTKCVERVKEITKYKKVPYDRWIKKIEFKNDQELIREFNELLNQLIPNNKEILEFKKRYMNVALDFYIRSDYGQLGFVLTSEVLQKMALLDIEANFHILSFGLVK